MKITKRQLRRIIKEESSRLLSEDKDQNKDGKNDFEDVKIARMKASGMSDEEIKKKHPDLFESENPHPKQYSAPQGSKRDSHLDYIQRLFKAADKLESQGKKAEANKKLQTAYEKRAEEEEKQRKKKGFKNKPRKDTKKESHHMRMTESDLREVIRNLLSEKLSKKTKATLKKKAEKRGLTPGSVYAEFRKGLAAWASSGSRKGMSQHQWAHARVNSATPSKPWAVVKKSKAKKKKGKKK